jgi:outer membrane receptor protein involved in Fe transport
VPEHRGSFLVQYSNPRWVDVAFDLQASGDQFDDDLNTASRVLPKYTLINVNVARDVSRNVAVFLGVQNMLDEEYYVGSNPILIGAPRMVSGGLRIRVQGR